MAITQKPINCCTPETSPEKSDSKVSDYDDLESAFLAIIGNWKKLRRQDNKDIYKCSECDCKLEVEKKGSIYKVRVKHSLSSDSHNWFDQQHIAPF
jgi:hypothetical protein